MSFSLDKRSELKRALIESIGELDNNFSVSAFGKSHNINSQTVYRYLRSLEAEGIVKRIKAGRSNYYSLIRTEKTFKCDLNGTTEDTIWKKEIAPELSDLPKTAFTNVNYAFTEMLNNAIDHSGGTTAQIYLAKDGYKVLIAIHDNGVGIFKKISEAMGLEEKRFAVLELAKGKFTTSPKSHSGEGIFFSSKAVDTFIIIADGLIFMPLKKNNENADSILQSYNMTPEKLSGTTVLMTILYSHNEPLSEIFDKYTQEPDHYGFSKTIVPVRLLEYGEDSPTFISRSQAKRLLARFEKFSQINLDFTGIDEIGQGFADEIFRVFPSRHPGTKISAANCNKNVQMMIDHVLN